MWRTGFEVSGRIPITPDSPYRSHPPDRASSYWIQRRGAKFDPADDKYAPWVSLPRDDSGYLGGRRRPGIDPIAQARWRGTQPRPCFRCLLCRARALRCPRGPALRRYGDDRPRRREPRGYPSAPFIL